MNNHDKFSKIVKKYEPDFRYRDYYYYGIGFNSFYKRVIKVLEENEELIKELSSNYKSIKDRILNIWRGFNMENLIKEELSYNYEVKSSKQLDDIGIDILLEQEGIAIQVKPISFLKFDLDKQQKYITDIVVDIDFKINQPSKRFKFILILYDKENLYYSTVKDVINYNPRTKTIRTHEICEIDNPFILDYLQDIIDIVKEP